MIASLIFSYAWSVALLALLTLASRTTGLRVAASAMLCGATASVAVSVLFQRLSIMLTGASVLTLGYTADPLVEELMKILPLGLAIAARSARRRLNASDYVLIAGASGSGFGLVESLLRYAMTDPMSRSATGWSVGIFGSVVIPDPHHVITGWFVSIEPAVGAVPSAINLHLAWSSLAGLGVYWLVGPRPAKLLRFAGGALVWLAWGHHAAYNGALAYPTTFTNVLIQTVGRTVWLTTWLPAIACLGALATDRIVSQSSGPADAAVASSRRLIARMIDAASQRVTAVRRLPQVLSRCATSHPIATTLIAVPALFYAFGGTALGRPLQNAIASPMFRPIAYVMGGLALARMMLVIARLLPQLKIVVADGSDDGIRARMSSASMIGSAAALAFAAAAPLLGGMSWSEGGLPLHAITALMVSAAINLFLLALEGLAIASTEVDALLDRIAGTHPPRSLSKRSGRRRRGVASSNPDTDRKPTGAHAAKLVDRDLLAAIMPSAGARADRYVDALDASMRAHGITTPGQRAAFLAQISVESQELHHTSENLNYSAGRLTRVWPRRFPDLESTAGYAHNPEGLANRVYANRMGNGAEQSGDGWLYRGRGLLQLTGRSNYERYGYGTDPDALSEPEGAAESAARFWSAHDLAARSAEPLDRAGFDRISRTVNGGREGSDERWAAYGRAMDHLKDTK